jgi:hypothetical protein
MQLKTKKIISNSAIDRQAESCKVRGLNLQQK